MNQPIETQQAYWTKWSAEGREHRLSDISRDQLEVVLGWLTSLGKTELKIIEVGCGAGWLCPTLMQFGRTTATDLCADVLSRARARLPEVEFVAGDFMALDFDAAKFDVVVTLEMLSHVADQDAFISKLARMLKPGGVLMLGTQNRPVLQNYNNIPAPGQLRRWVDKPELEALLKRHFQVRQVLTITPNANKGVMRFIAGRSAKRVMRAIAGKAVERRLAAAGFGWTLMALAEKSVEAAD
jgi:2-polyprenyl-3-methyl-5-hydroxy-6-metoxy-1,4-benzoquinol methylase